MLGKCPWFPRALTAKSIWSFRHLDNIVRIVLIFWLPEYMTCTR